MLRLGLERREAKMVDINSFAVLGGDKRQAALAESIAADGYTVYAWGFDRLDLSESVRKTDLAEAVSKCVNIVLPLPVTQDGVFLNAKYTDEKVRLDEGLAELMLHKQVFGGKMGKLFATSDLWYSIDTCDYYAREEFAVRHAIATSEGAIEIAVREYAGTLNGGRCLVAGFGRIGKALAWMLRGMGACVTVSARKPEDFAWIELYGYEAIRTDHIGHSGSYDVVFNTIPAMVFNRRLLAKMRPGTLLIDLASEPGGVDFPSAGELGIPTVHALSLPGKVAPKASGEIIKNIIYSVMEE